MLQECVNGPAPQHILVSNLSFSRLLISQLQKQEYKASTIFIFFPKQEVMAEFLKIWSADHLWSSRSSLVVLEKIQKKNKNSNELRITL